MAIKGNYTDVAVIGGGICGVYAADLINSQFKLDRLPVAQHAFAASGFVVGG